MYVLLIEEILATGIVGLVVQCIVVHVIWTDYTYGWISLSCFFVRVKTTTGCTYSSIGMSIEVNLVVAMDE